MRIAATFRFFIALGGRGAGIDDIRHLKPGI